jgi:hypothetical protein
MPLARLGAVWPPHDSRAAGARALAQSLLDIGSGRGGWPHREVPDVGDAAVGDQLAVVGRDVLALELEDAARAEIAVLLRQARITL